MRAGENFEVNDPPVGEFCPISPDVGPIFIFRGGPPTVGRGLWVSHIQTLDRPRGMVGPVLKSASYTPIIVLSFSVSEQSDHGILNFVFVL